METLELKNKEISNEKYILLTHTDLDGAGCAIVFSLAVDNPGCIYYCANGREINSQTLAVFNEAKNDPDTEYHVYIADNSIEEFTAEKVSDFLGFNPNNIFRLLDHHESALPLADKYDWATIDITECGTTLIFEHMKSKVSERLTMDAYAILLELLNHIKNWDLFLWKDNGDNFARIHNTLCKDIGLVEYTNRMINRIISEHNIINETEFTDISEKLDHIDKYIEDNVDKFNIVVADHIKKTDIPDTFTMHKYTVAVTFATSNISELGNAICEKHDDIDFCALIDLSKGDFGIVSLRATKDNIDLSKIAKSHGGGGHRKAAGFPLTKETLNDILRSITAALNILE